MTEQKPTNPWKGISQGYHDHELPDANAKLTNGVAVDSEFDTTTPIPPRSKWKDLAERMPVGAHKTIGEGDLSSFQAALNKSGKGIVTRAHKCNEACKERHKELTGPLLDVWVTEKKKATKPRKPRAKKETATPASA